MTTWAVIPAKSLAAAKTRLAPALAPAARAALARRLFTRTVRAARACPALAGVIVVSADAELRALAEEVGARAYADPPHSQVHFPLEGEGEGFLCGGRLPSPASGRGRPDRRRSRGAGPKRSAGWAVGSRVGPGDHSAWVGGEGSAGEGSAGEGSLNRAITLGCRRAADLGAGAALVLPADLPLLTPEAIAHFLEIVGEAVVGVAPDRAETGTNALLLRPPDVLAPAFGPDSFTRHRELARSQGLSLATVRVPELALDLDTPADLAHEHGYMTSDVEAACV